DAAPQALTGPITGPTTGPTTGRSKPGSRAVAALGLAVLLTAIAAVNVHAMRHGGASGFVADGESSTTRALGGSPPVTVTTHPSRLIPNVAAPDGSGGYAFDAPARFDPCQPIRYVISGAQPFEGANTMLTQALSEVS